MNIKVHELMTSSVVTTEPHATISHVRNIMEDSKIGAVPVVNIEGRPVGIVSMTDCVSELDPGSPVAAIMTEKVYCVPQYEDVSIAARVMRNRGIHRVIVTHEQKVVGVLSTFDLLKLVEEHRFVARNAPTVSRRRGSKKR